jgi:hypothetical protein
MMRRAEKIVSRAKDAKVPQIPLFPPLSKGDERGISGFLCELGAINFLKLGLFNYSMATI